MRGGDEHRVWQWLRGYTENKTPAKAARLVLGTFHRENPGAAMVPVPVPDIAGWMGVVVRFTGEPMAQSACLDPTGPQPEVVLRGSDHQNHWRFSMAHELGHLMLHDLAEVHDRNDFAAELLMPGSWIEADVFMYDTDVTRLARKFLVSEVVMTYRLKALRMVP